MMIAAIIVFAVVFAITCYLAYTVTDALLPERCPGALADVCDYAYVLRAALFLVLLMLLLAFVILLYYESTTVVARR